MKHILILIMYNKVCVLTCKLKHILTEKKRISLNKPIFKKMLDLFVKKNKTKH